MSIRNINHRIIWIKNIIFSLAVFVLHLFCYKPLSFLRSDFWYRNQIGAWRWPDMWYPTILKKCRKKSVATSMMITTLCSFLLFNSFCWTHWCKYHFSYCSCLPSKHYKGKWPCTTKTLYNKKHWLVDFINIFFYKYFYIISSTHEIKYIAL